MPERQLLLEIELTDDAALVHDATDPDFKSRIAEFVDGESAKMGATLSAGMDRVEIEGLAIHPSSKTVYLGLRKPMLVSAGGEQRAIVLSVPLAEMFKKAVSFALFALRLRTEEHDYAVVSLEYDKATNRILVLGGATEKADYFPPVLWSWEPTPGKAYQEPAELAASFVRFPEYERAKLEAVVPLPGDAYLAFFVDSDGHGGQRVLARSDLGLPSP